MAIAAQGGRLTPGSVAASGCSQDALRGGVVRWPVPGPLPPRRIAARTAADWNV